VGGELAAALACGCENLCHQAIFMDHATSAVTPLDPELVQAGDAVGQRAERRGLLQGSVRPVGVVEILVLPQHGHQVPLVPDQRPVQQVPPAAANPVPPEYSIAWLTCAVTCGLDAVVVGWPGAVTALVPLVYLPASLTAPGPSGSTRPTRLRRGCSRPPRRPPDQASSSFSPDAVTSGRRSPFIPVLSNSAPWT
jgi:hypothetical protein